jgi:hypothetical protein
VHIFPLPISHRAIKALMTTTLKAEEALVGMRCRAGNFSLSLTSRDEITRNRN